MEFVLRAVAVYVILLVLFRLMGKRTLGELTTFDLVLVLILSEATENALLDDDKSVVAGLAVILTFLLLDLLFSMLKQRFDKLEKVTEGVPLVLVEHGKPIEEHLSRSSVSRSDIMQAARMLQGVERMEQIKYAVLEPSGDISVIPSEAELEAQLDRRIEQALRRLQDRQG